MRGIRRVQRWLRQFRPTTLILCYHRVTELESDPHLLSVTPQNFREQLQVLKRLYRVARLQDWASEQTIAARPTVIVTFDDGYADNFDKALPLLQEAECPATIFVTAGKIGDNREFWWDELDRVILEPAHLPEELSLSIRGHDHYWNTAATCDRQRRDGWHVLLEQKATPRQAAYVGLCHLLKVIDEVERSRVLDELCTWAGVERLGRSSHRSLTAPELCSLAASELIEIGSHTITHPQLSSLPASAQQFEIEKSKAMLESSIGRPVHSFSYPFGGVNDYNLDTIRMVRNAGFHCACANYPGLSSHAAERYQLPRFVVRNWGGDYFAKTLKCWTAS